MQGGYPPQQHQQQQGGYPPQGYPPSSPQHPGATAQHGGYPAPQGYPPQPQGGYPPQGYPPSQSPHQGYPPQQGGGGGQHYTPLQGGYPPQQGYAQGGGYPPQEQPWWAQYYPYQNQQLIGQITNWFQSVDADKSGFLDQIELTKALTQAGLNLSPENVNKILRTFDVYKTGTLRLFEFVCLYQFLTQMRNSFYQFDNDRSGTLDWGELGRVLAASGFQLSPASVTALATKFDPTRKGGINLEGFTELVLFLANLRNFFHQQSLAQGQGGFQQGGQGGQQQGGHSSGGPPAQGHASGSEQAITITFDQFVSAVPYFA